MSTWAWACNKYMTSHCDKGKEGLGGRVGFALETKNTHFIVNDEAHRRGTLRSLGKGAVTH